MILVPANKVEKIKYFSTLLGLIFIEITRGPFAKIGKKREKIRKKKNGKKRENQEGSFTLPLLTDRAGYTST